MHQTSKKIPASSLWMYVVVFAVWLLFSVLVTAFAVSSSLHAAQDRSTQFSRSLYADLFDTMQANEAALEGFAALFGAIGKTDEDTAPLPRTASARRARPWRWAGRRWSLWSMPSSW